MTEDLLDHLVVIDKGNPTSFQRRHAGRSGDRLPTPSPMCFAIGIFDLMSSRHFFEGMRGGGYSDTSITSTAAGSGVPGSASRLARSPLARLEYPTSPRLRRARHVKDVLPALIGQEGTGPHAPQCRR